jgi:uncharacterized protein
MDKLKRVFVGAKGLRSGWKFLLFAVLYTFSAKATFWVVTKLGYVSPKDWHWTNFLFEEVMDFGLAALVALGIARILKEKFSSYGLPFTADAGKLAVKGWIWGFVPSAIILIPLFATGACSYHGLALQGGELLSSTVGWALAMLSLGLAEEFVFRGFTLKTLADGIGFWPAAIFLSAIFGMLHLLKPMENWIDAVSVGLYGLLWSLMLKRTGSLWFPIGFHAASDYADMIMFAEPNTGNNGQPIPGHLLEIRFHGPDWLTGGPRGTEASLLVFVILAGLFYIFDKAYPGTIANQADSAHPKS